MNTNASLFFSTGDLSAAAARRNETLFTTANGYLGLRGDYEESNCCFHKGTYINGFYDTEPIIYGETAYGYAKNHETILNLPDPKHIVLSVNGICFSMKCGVTSSVMSLDFRTGIMTRTVHCTSSDGTSFTVKAERLVSFENKTCAALRYSVTADACAAGSAAISLESAIDMSVSNISAEEDPRVGAKFSSRRRITGSTPSSDATLCRSSHIGEGRKSVV